MFEKYEPQAGDQILSAHIRNLEDYIAPLITIDNGSEISGVTKLIIGNNLLASGTVSGGITLYTTGIAGFTTNLSGLTDVDVSGSTVGDLLIKNSDGKWRYVPSGSVGGGNISLDNLTDVITTGAISGDLLMLNSDGIWRGVSTGAVRGTFALSGATDTNINLATDGSLLVKSGGLWTYMSSGVLVDSNYLDELVDVNVSGAIAGNLLILNNDNIWRSIPSGTFGTSNVTDLNSLTDVVTTGSISGHLLALNSDGVWRSIPSGTIANAGSYSLSGLTDVNVSGATSGHLLALNSDGVWRSIPSGNLGGSNVTTLDSLTDVIATGATIGDILILNSDNIWRTIPSGVFGTSNISTLDSLTDVVTTSSTSGHLLLLGNDNIWRSISSGVVANAGSYSLSGLTDVDTSGATSGYLLMLNNSGVWVSVASGHIVSNATDLKPIGTINFNNQDISNIKSIFAKDIEVTASGLTESFNFFTSGNTGSYGVILNANRDTSSVDYGGHIWSEGGYLFLGNGGGDYFVISPNKIFPVNNDASLGDLVAPFQDIYTTNIYSNDYLENSGLVVIGNNAGNNPQLILKGATTGDVIFTVNPNTDTWFFTLPTNAGTSGQYLQTNGSGVTSWATVAGGGGGITWTEVTGTSQSMSVNTGYIANNAGLVTLTLPSTSAVGDVVRVTGKGAGGWKIAQNASGVIHFGNTDTTTGTGGYLQFTHRRDSVELVCVVANTEWNVVSSMGVIDLV